MNAGSNKVKAAKHSLALVVLVLLLATLACALPTIQLPQIKTAPTQAATVASPVVLPAPTQPAATAASQPKFAAPPAEDQPPVLVEVQPPPGSDLTSQTSLVFYFSTPMDQESVQRSTQIQPALESKFEWQDASTLRIAMSGALPPSSDLSITFNNKVRSVAGKFLVEPVELHYQTPPALMAVERLPQPGANNTDPSAAVVATFSRPVVPLVGEVTALPAGFSLQPAAQGRGEWLNTSTYIFYPQPSLAGGTIYTVLLNTGLGLDAGQNWSFTTTLPEVLKVEPDFSKPVWLDAPIVVYFNQPMNASSVQENFLLQSEDEARIPGKFTWNDDATQVSFQPEPLLNRETTYNLTIAPNARDQGGTPLARKIEAQFVTVSSLAVQESTPQAGQPLNLDENGFASINLVFNAPLARQDLSELVSFSPPVADLYTYQPDDGRQIWMSGYLDPSTDYTLTLSPGIKDRWDQPLGSQVELAFTTSAAPPSFRIPVVQYGPVIFATTADTSLSARATNIQSVNILAGNLNLADFFTFTQDSAGAQPPAQNSSWEQALELPENKIQPVSLNLTAEGSALTPGLYYYAVTAPQAGGQYNKGTEKFALVVSDIHMLLKRSEGQIFLWAYDLPRQTPAARMAVDFYDGKGNLLTSAVTDDQGVAQVDLPAGFDIYTPVYASAGKPGEPNFSLAGTNWNMNLYAWQYTPNTNLNSILENIYLYTDRPIYRPGQKVYFRGILRQENNTRYSLPDLARVPAKVMGVSDTGEPPVLFSQELDVSDFGTFSGEFDLPAGAQPGYYTIQVGDPVSASLGFPVVEYRKPEIDLQVQIDPADQTAAQDLKATVKASYYFGAPAGRLSINWMLNSVPSTFSLPDGYRTGKDLSDAQTVAQGQAQTAADGTLSITIPSGTLKEKIDPQSLHRLTLEVSAMDESQQPVSARAQVNLHPADFYIGVKPSSWFVPAGQEVGFDVQTVTWQRAPSGDHALTAVFQRVVWKQDVTSSFRYPRMVAEYTDVGSTDFRTDASGRARLAFTPDQPGTYQVVVSGEGAVTVAELWVGGAGSAAWPELPLQQLELVSDSDSYKPGDTAKLLIPNPFPGGAQALITIERGKVMRWQVLEIEGSSATFDLPLNDEDAPNVYLSVTLLNRDADAGRDFRQGYLKLKVDPLQETLQVQAVISPDKAAPRQEVNLALQVKDAQGQPVEGEFSLALIDKAVLALADPNSPDIVSAFYGEQPLGVQTSLPLAAYSGRIPAELPGGRGGGAEQPGSVREQFADTAYWNAQVRTDANGSAVVTAQLPDNLTTWVLDVRGLTKDTRVGSATAELVTSKDLLVRPALPRFLVAGDHVELAAVINNNTAGPLQVDVSLQAEGVTLDNPDQAAVRVDIPAGDRRRVGWWARVQAVDEANLLFTARSGALEDAVRPEQGALPVLRYTASQTFATAGTLSEAAERSEWVSLPRSFTPQGGELRVELTPSLAAAVMHGLKTLESHPSDFAESAISRLLPNVEAYQALQKLGVDAPELKASLDKAVREDLRTLARLQNQDGGWGWFTGFNSDPYISAYVLFGLSRVKAAGIDLPANLLENGVGYLSVNTGQPEDQMETWQLDRLLFQYFALQQAGGTLSPEIWFAYSQRLSPWANAFLAVMAGDANPSDPRVTDLISRLEGEAQRSASGARWTGSGPQFRNFATPAFSTAAVVYALAKWDPASKLLVDGVRYLVSIRQSNGGWYSSYDTAWTIIALVEALQGTGDLQARYDYAAVLNGTQIASGSVSGPADLTPVDVTVPLEQLSQQAANQLAISRDQGAGRLYYRAFLRVDRPAQDAPAVDRGLSISRSYQLAGQDCRAEACPSLTSVKLAAPAPVILARLSVTVPSELTNVVVEDFIPAGSEILNAGLNTSQQLEVIDQQNQPGYNPRDPFARGWGWWFFSQPQIYDDHIRWFAETLPAGTYELTYRLVVTQSGEYQVLPARAYAYYFPEIQGSSAGEVFTIQP